MRIGFYFTTSALMGNMKFYYAALVGVVIMMLVVLITEYYTSIKYRHVNSIAAVAMLSNTGMIVTLDYSPLLTMPGFLAIFVPLLVGFSSGPKALAGLLIGLIVAGLCLPS